MIVYFDENRTRRCPWCKSIPRITIARNGETRVECVNFDECEILPNTRWHKDTEEAIKIWNKMGED